MRDWVRLNFEGISQEVIDAGDRLLDLSSEVEEMEKKYSIEKITGDNHRPGMPKGGYLVRHNPHESFGWLSCSTFETLQEAEDFARTI